MRNLRYSILLFVLPFFASCASSPQGAEAYKGRPPQEVFTKGEKALSKKHYKDAVSCFEAFDALYPFDARAEQALLDSIYAYYKSNDADSALAAADRYERLYPMSPNIPYVIYLRGITNMERNISWMYNAFPVDPAKRDLSSMQQSFSDFQRLVHNYPNCVYAKDAHKRMLHIRNMLGRRELQTAEFYYLRHAYVASANRASYVVQHFQGAPQIPAALALMVKSYRQLGETDLANDALRVLQINFPNHPELRNLENQRK